MIQAKITDFAYAKLSCWFCQDSFKHGYEYCMRCKK